LSNGAAGRAIDLLIGTGTVTVGGTLTQSGGANVTFSGAGILNVKKDYVYSSGGFTAGTGTVQYNGTLSQNIAALVYNHLTINKASGIASINAVSTVSGNLTVSAGELDVNAAMTITGNTGISSGAVLYANAVTVNAGGNWTNSGTFNAGTGTIIFNGTGIQNINTTAFNNVTVNKSAGSVVLTGNCTANGNLTITSGTLDLSTFIFNRVSLGGILTVANGANLYLAGSNNFPANFASNNLGISSTVLYNGTIVQAVAGVVYGNLSCSNGGAVAKTLLSSATINGDLLINSGSNLNAGGFSITLLGNWTNSGIFTAAAGTIICNGISKLLSGNTTFNNFTVNGSYTIANNDDVFNGLINITATGNLNAGSGVGTVNGDLTNRGILTSSGTTTFSGTALQTLRLINAISSTSTGIINFNGNISPVMNSTSSPQFATLNINNTAGINPSISWTVFVAMNVNSGGVFNGGFSTHHIYGHFTSTGTTTSTGVFNFIPTAAKTVNFGSAGFSSTGTVIFGGTGSLSMAGTPGSLNDVVIANTNAAGITPSSGWNMTGKFSINSNTIFNAATFSYTVGTDLESDGTLNGGSSTFTMNSTTGTLTGSATTSFYNFTIGAAAVITANSDFSVMGNYTNNGTYDGTLGTLIMTGSTASVIGGTPVSNALSQLIIAKTNSTVTMAVSLNNVFILYIQSGTLSTATFGITQDVSGGFLIIDNGATLKLGGTNSLPAFSGYALDANSNVEYAGTTQSIGNAAIYGNLWITAAGNKNAIVPFSTLGNFTLSNGTFTSLITVTHNIGGNWLMTGGTFTNTNITIQLNGDANQTISSTGDFKNLIINKTSGQVILASNIAINSTITLTNGKINLQNYNLTIAPAASISGVTSSKYFIAEGTGTLIQQVTAAGNKIFPVGTLASYLPATIVLSAGSTTDNFMVRVQNFVQSRGTNGNILTNFAVNNTWFINEGIAGGSNATVTLQWPASIELLGFERIQSRVSQSSGSFYAFGPVSSAVGANPYTSSNTGITSFFAFAVLNDVVVLESNWVTVNGENKGSDNHINWSVANEKPNARYIIEYAANAVNFTAIGSMAGKGNPSSANTYNFIHFNISSSLSYYRIKQWNADGSYFYSPVIRIISKPRFVNDLRISSNPVVANASLLFNSSFKTKISLLVFDASGKKLKEKSVVASKGNNIVPMDLAGLQAGIYFIQFTDEQNTKQVIKFCKL
jgi:hypothetical protein